MKQTIEYCFSTIKVKIKCTLEYMGSSYSAEFTIDRILLHQDIMWRKVKECFHNLDLEFAKSNKFV
jgi:hypothetical protein